MNTKRTEKGKGVTIWIDESMVKDLDRLAKEADMSRSRVLRIFVKMGLWQYMTHGEPILPSQETMKALRDREKLER